MQIVTNMEEPFFTFELFTPIITFESQSLSDVLVSLYDDYEILPMAIIMDRENPVFEAIVDNRPIGGSPVDCVIIPIRYLNQFLT